MCILYPDGPYYIHFDLVQDLANMKPLHMTSGGTKTFSHGGLGNL